MGNNVIARRVTAHMDRGFIVFLIGMRVNRWWKIHKWLPVARAMLRMGEELKNKPDSGYLGGQVVPGLIVQYWASIDKLVAYARDRTGEHFPAWASFYQSIGTGGDVGIWHETYIVGPGSYECVYVNMPPHGLGTVGKLVPARGERYTAKQRVGAAIHGSGDPGAGAEDLGSAEQEHFISPE